MSDPGAVVVIPVSVDELAKLVRKAVREELSERGYAAQDELLSKAQLAKLFGVTVRTITTWMAREGLPHSKGHGGHIVFQRAQVVQWSKDNGVALKLKAVG